MSLRTKFKLRKEFFMNKTEFIKTFADNAGISARQGEEFYKYFIDTITAELKKGEQINLTGFGVFSIKERKAHDGVNPLTHQKIKIAAARVPALKFSKSYKESI